MKQLVVTILVSFILSTIAVSQNKSERKSAKEMDDRKLIYCPKPQYAVQDTGVVKVNLWIDKEGSVINAEQDTIETTATNKVLIEDALISAYKLKFSAIDKDTVMIGSFTYRFDIE